MKRKDIVYLLLAAVIMTVAGLIFYKQIAPQKQTGVQVEVVEPIKDSFNQEALSKLGDPAVAKDYYQSVDPLGEGIGASSPFGPF
jgi:nucleoside permease NupC